MAYRRGRSAEDIAKTYIYLLEEANETGKPVIMISEDEEKFFDRINLETQASNMVACGMPEQGWLELKMEDMTDRICFLLTEIGEVMIKYKVGFPQGQVLSCLGANLTSQNKLSQWTAEDPNCPIIHNKGFKFAARDPLDEHLGRLLNVLKKNYSNDSSLLIYDNNSRDAW